MKLLPQVSSSLIGSAATANQTLDNKNSEHDKDSMKCQDFWRNTWGGEE